MTRDQNIFRLAYWIACGMIACVLLFGIQKVLYPDEFALAVYRFHLLPDSGVNWISLHLAWLEVVCAGCLLFIPRLRTAALCIVGMLFLIFAIGIAINLLRGSSFSCGCFSTSPLAKPMSWSSVVRNLALVALTGLALWGHRAAYSNKPRRLDA